MRHRQIRLLNRFLPRLRIRILKRIEMLHQPDDGVTSLGECVLLYIIRLACLTKKTWTGDAHDQDKFAAPH